MDSLKKISVSAGNRTVEGLPDEYIKQFSETDVNLSQAIQTALEEWTKQTTLNQISEDELIESVTSGWCNFYPAKYRTPYVPLAAKGPWVISTHGAVIHDSGGYGMLGLGHSPDAIVKSMGNGSHVIANIMTPSLSHPRFIRAIRDEIGHTRSSGCPYSQFLLMNSGSEANAVADRIVDCHTGVLKGSRRGVVCVSLQGCFHGRTFKPAVWTDSGRPAYEKSKCTSIIDAKDSYLRTVRVNDCAHLTATFAEANRNGEYIELVVLEAVMGEGNPGESITPEFYNLARKLTLGTDSCLLIDSVQAGMRCNGVLSIIDYPGFENSQAPDMESFSKAINAGQYPVSVLALTERSAKWYQPGIYGNTMTGNPRACEVATAVLGEFKGEAGQALRKNIVDMGKYAVASLNKLKEKFPDLITRVCGTGLLYSIHLDEHTCPIADHADGSKALPAERWLRLNGIGVIHGGDNALRFTPSFRITKQEVDLQVSMVEKYIIAAKTAMAGETPSVKKVVAPAAPPTVQLKSSS